jgi:hypothetical protein
MEANCATSCEACFASTACVNWLYCAVNCYDQACLDACSTQYPAGEAPAMAWLGDTGCLGTHCEVACDTTGGTIDECKASIYADPACGACMEANCATECEACYYHPTCMDWLYCAIYCYDQACLNNCTVQYPGGEAPAMAWLGTSGCVEDQCSTACN